MDIGDCMKNIVIVGGSDVGISAALRIKELDPSARVTIVSANNFPNYSICGIPFYLGGEVKHYTDLAHRTADNIRATGIELLLETTVTELDAKAKTAKAVDKDGRVTDLAYDKLVLGTGGRSIRPNIRGLDLPGVYFMRWIDDALAFDAYLREMKPKSAVIVGGGYIGLEMAEALIRRGLSVTLLEFADMVLTTVDAEFSALVKASLEAKGVKIETGKVVRTIEASGGGLSVAAEPDFTVQADCALVAVGAVPETELARRAGAETGLKGALKISRRMETSLPDIYAGGDCAESVHALTAKPVYIALGTTAHKHGRIIGDNICGVRSDYLGTLGTQSIKLFDMVIARTGMNEAEAQAAGFDARTGDFETWDHKVYYPPAYKTRVRLTVDANTRRLLGCQILGDINAEISKRVDIVAVAIHRGLTLDEFIQMDLSYTPPLSSPWDPLQMAAQAWS
jgi:NADPH-dependent 2,4-dienoyl-CoA reductase/sulfur reductase-like enzyme